MDIPKYAIAENERRCWVERVKGIDLDLPSSALVCDLYLEGSRLRLRSVQRADGSRQYKLCKKYATDDAFSGAIVNTYLSPEEHALLSDLPGRRIRKRRHWWQEGDNRFGVDVFEGELSGLVLCEIEKPTREALLAVEFPSWATLEVTEDPFFRGGHLSGVSAAELADKLRSLR